MAVQVPLSLWTLAMAPKRRSPAPSSNKPSRKPKRTAVFEIEQAAAPPDVLQELGRVLGANGRAMPAIRKVHLADGVFVSVYDVILAIKGCSCEDAAKEFKRLRERYPEDRWAACPAVSFRDSRGRTDPNRKTPVADALDIIKIVLLLPGELAARVRTQASEVFVRFLGGAVARVPPPNRVR